MASKEELLKRAKELAENENLTASLAKVAELRRQWRRPDESESLYEQELGQKFEEYLDIIASKTNTVNQSVEERKNDLISKAKEVLNEKNFKKATQMMNDLMAEWKVSGHLEKEKDDELWASFKEVRDTFFANRKEYYETLTERFAANKAAKEALIEEAKAVVAMENMKEAT
ncbi:MAG: DUF349 domain-containing protein, partial [Erysipelotrichaceae bacterium]|nr:DUF349 domain-containing protein [Erysipelotrichaceae bacterium]